MEMPSDWNDAAGWERYYASLYPSGAYKEHRNIGSIPPRDLPDFVAGLLEQGRKNAWVPGCGFSPLPKLLAELGLDVHATDISPTAIAYQQSADNNITVPKSKKKVDSIGSLSCVAHDFRQPYLENHFDLLINVKAIQAFPSETMRQIANVHYRALKPDGHAYFDTMNVQGENRETLEAVLVEAGFFLPFYELNRWYRQQLRDTEIPHVFILGQPMIPSTGIYVTDKDKWKEDMAVLRAIASEHKEKAQKEQEAEQVRLKDNDRLATIIYSTG